MAKINKKTPGQLAINKFFEVEVEGKKICEQYSEDQSFKLMELFGSSKEKAESFSAIPEKFLKRWLDNLLVTS
jgi:hypothetical protein